MSFEDEKDPANQPIDREEWEAHERYMRARQRLNNAAEDMLAVCKESRSELIRFCHLLGLATPAGMRELKEKLDVVIAKAEAQT